MDTKSENNDPYSGGLKYAQQNIIIIFEFISDVS